jgi:hypothetical protein
MSAFRAAHERRNLRQLERRVLHELAFLSDDLKTELHVLGAVAGERVETDFDEFDAFGALRGGLFLNRINDGADEMDFVHKMFFKSATASCAGQCAKAGHRLAKHGSTWWDERPRKPELMGFVFKIGSPGVSPHQSWFKLPHHT